MRLTYNNTRIQAHKTKYKSHKLNAKKNCKIENTLFWNFKSSNVIGNYRTWDYNPYTKYLKSRSY